jgi:Regulator of ribonuclease activity B
VRVGTRVHADDGLDGFCQPRHSCDRSRPIARAGRRAACDTGSSATTVRRMSSDSEYTVLGRFDPNDPDDPDGDTATLAALAASGSDMSKPTHFIHYLSFTEQEHAQEAAKALNEHLGYRTRGFGPDTEVPHWSVWAEIEREPTIENVRRMRQVMLTAAERYDGEYDGWEAEVQS